MGIELILNATNINVVAFSHFMGNPVDGPIFAIFVILLAATEAVVGLALILAIFSRYRTINVDDVAELKG
jgi:NADH-quinone oxidoreductase subunit K